MSLCTWVYIHIYFGFTHVTIALGNYWLVFLIWLEPLALNEAYLKNEFWFQVFSWLLVFIMKYKILIIACEQDTLKYLEFWNSEMDHYIRNGSSWECTTKYRKIPQIKNQCWEGREIFVQVFSKSTSTCASVRLSLNSSLFSPHFLFWTGLYLHWNTQISSMNLQHLEVKLNLDTEMKF